MPEPEIPEIKQTPLEKLILDLSKKRGERVLHTQTIERAIAVLSTLNIHGTNTFGEEATDQYKKECMIKYKLVLKNN